MAVYGRTLLSIGKIWPVMQVAFTLYLIVLFPGGPPVVTNTGTWQNVADCKNAADAAAFVPKNKEGDQLPSISFMCVPRSGFGPPISPRR